MVFERTAQRLKYNFYRRVLRTPVRRPVFIVGCGRSGTTILGQSLAKHPNVAYLNEPRDLWIDAYPICDIWSEFSEQRGGKLSLTEEDVRYGASRRLRASFRAYAAMVNRPQLVEKLPINSFRIRFLASIFPDARFIHMVRSGPEVARSIASLAADGGWYGHEDYKWRRIADFARSSSSYRSLPDQCESAYERGLLEWRMSVESGRRDLESTVPADRRIEVRYDVFIDDPVATVRTLEEFIGLHRSEQVEGFVRENIRRRSPRMEHYQATEKEQRLGGRLLCAEQPTVV